MKDIINYINEGFFGNVSAGVHDYISMKDEFIDKIRKDYKENPYNWDAFIFINDFFAKIPKYAGIEIEHQFDDGNITRYTYIKMDDNDNPQKNTRIKFSTLETLCRVQEKPKYLSVLKNYYSTQTAYNKLYSAIAWGNYKIKFIYNKKVVE